MIFAQVPANPLNRLVEVDATHMGTPAASRPVLFQWLKELTGR
jgi:hypothetical protein